MTSAAPFHANSYFEKIFRWHDEEQDAHENCHGGIGNGFFGKSKQVAPSNDET